MPAMTSSLRREKRTITLLDLVDDDLNMEEYYNNANETLYINSENRYTLHDSLLKMRKQYISNK
jgi:hypothetical protein